MRFGANHIGETLGSPTGGVRTGTIYEGRLKLLLDLDLEKAVDWSGASFHVNAYQIHGRGLSASNLRNNLLTVSNIEAERTTRLFDLWLQQKLLDDLVSVRAGQIAADDEFFTSLYASTLINSTFGWPAILAADLPSGGPAYPLATPGVRVALVPNGPLSFAAAVFNGDPAGPGPDNPQLRDASGTSFRIDDGAFTIGEAAYALNQEREAAGLPGTYKLGAWYHTGGFADQRFDTRGLSLANPASSGVPKSHHGDYGLYAILDQMVWRQPDTTNEGLGVFLRLAGTPSDRNQIDFYADSGLAYAGLLPGREADVLALGFAYAQIGDSTRGLDADMRSFTGVNRPIGDSEIALEVTYKAQATPWWTLQPDLQWIRHPGGHSPDPTDPTGTRAIRNAAVIGLRTSIAF